MTTLRLTPAAELHIVCDQNTVFPETIFTFTDENDNPVDMRNYAQELIVRENNSGSVILEWSTADDTITIEGADHNQVVLGERTADEMNITAKTYVYSWKYTLTGQEPVQYFKGNLIINPTV
jgi:hypothetical protein